MGHNSQLTPSKVGIGFIGAIYSLGFYLPQILTANLAERLRYKKPFVALVGGLGERLPYLLMGLAVWGLADRTPGAALAILLFLLGVSAFSNGIATPAWFDMIAKVIPVQARGRFSGVGHSLGALLGIGGAALAGQILASQPFPRSFALCFVVASAAMAISWAGLALTREPPSLVTKPSMGLARYLGQLPTILRRDHNYARFLIARSVGILGSMAAGFFMVYGASRFNLRGEEVGMLMALLVGSQAVANVLWGMAGDRFGHQRVLCGAAISMALAGAVALLAGSTRELITVYALLGIALAGDSVSGMNIILEFCQPADRPTYIGLTNTLLAPVRIVAPLLGGLLASAWGYPGLFAVATLVSAFGGVMLGLWVREPRRQTSPQALR